jgi:protein-disulfide isomerase
MPIRVTTGCRVSSTLMLATEAAGTHGRFWALTRELLARRHDDPSDLHVSLVRAGLDPQRTIAEMRAATGADRIVDDVTSARASGVTYAPALFINGEHYTGELDPGAVVNALAPCGAPDGRTAGARRGRATHTCRWD